MSNFKAFFKEAVKPIKEHEVALERFSEPIRVSPLSPEQQERVIDDSKKKTIGKKGRIEEKISEGKYLILQAAESIVYPDLEDAALQKSYGVMGREALVKAMFTADEISEIGAVLATSEDNKTTADLVEDAKN